MAYVEKRGQNSWRLVVDVGFDANGKRKRKMKTVKGISKKEAELELAKFLVEVQAGTYFQPQKMKFADFTEEWRIKYAEKQLSITTYQSYMGYLGNRIMREFGHMQLDEIRPIHVLNFLHNLENEDVLHANREGKLSSGTIHFHYRILRNIFNRAVEWQFVKENPVNGAMKPKVETPEMKSLAEKEIKIVFQAVEKYALGWRVLIKLAITTGLRRGELLGLTWEHVDLEKRELHVRKSLKKTKAGVVLGPPKTKSSIRTVPIPDFVIDELKQLKGECLKKRLKAGERWGFDHFLVFSSEIGSPLHLDSVTTWWSRFSEKLSIKKVRFHDLRHTTATYLISCGVHPKIIQEILGHSSFNVTMNIYGHSPEEKKRETADHFQRAFQ